MTPRPILRALLVVLPGMALGAIPRPAPAADGPYYAAPPRYVSTAARGPDPVYGYGLGTFYPSPSTFVRGNNSTGGGYSPLGSFGSSNMVEYGPISSFRSVTAPIRTYSRGYDGRLYPATEATGFSSPFLPGSNPVVYPTQGSNYYGFRYSKVPPNWSSGINWVDQN